MLDFPPRPLGAKFLISPAIFNGQDHEKLNQAYLYGNPGDGFHYWDDPSAGPGLLALTLNVNFGVNVNHYIRGQYEDVRQDGGRGRRAGCHVQGTGGIELRSESSSRLTSPQWNGSAGGRTQSCGWRFFGGDYQNIILCALQQKLTSPGVVTDIPELINAFQDSVQTNLSPQDMAQLACLGTQLPRENIALYNFPESLFTGSRIYDPVFPEQKKGVFYWQVDFNILRYYVEAFQAGFWPDDLMSIGTPSSTSTTTSFCQ